MSGIEERKRKEPPEWLKLMNSIPPCKECGVIVGGCMLEALGEKCKREVLEDE